MPELNFKIRFVYRPLGRNDRRMIHVVLIAIGALLIPLHHSLEKWITEKMTAKNKSIRLAAAKKTIEKLEKKTEQL